MRVLAFDTSLSLPGVAIIEVKRNKATIIALSHVKTNTSQSHGLRADIVESWATLFIAEHIGKNGFDVVIREDFHGQSSAQNYPVFAGWSGVERACDKFGLKFAKWEEVGKGGRPKQLLGIPQSKVKLLVVGKGKAEKPELAEAARLYTGYKGEFATFDESDAACVGLAYLIREGILKSAE